MFTLWITSVYPDNIHTHYVNKSLWNGKQYDFFVELNKTNCFHRLKISHWWTNRVVWRCLYFENIFHHQYQVQFAVFSCKIIPRNESFNEMLQITHFVAMHRPPELKTIPFRFSGNETKNRDHFNFILNCRLCSRNQMREKPQQSKQINGVSISHETTFRSFFLPKKAVTL